MKYWDRAWSLADGCTPVSPGCDHCWSKAMNSRFGKWPEKVTFREDRLEIPLKVKNPTVWAIWNDLFHEKVPSGFINRAWITMFNTPHHTYLILTKRPERMKSFTMDCATKKCWPFSELWPDNVWLGVTAENQEQADKRIPIILQIPASHRLLSIEPMLGSVNLNEVSYRGTLKNVSPGVDLPFDVKIDSLTGRFFDGWDSGQEAKFDAVILGGESGPGARPMHPDWVRSVRDQCQVAGVPFFFKQWGEWGLSMEEVRNCSTDRIEINGEFLSKIGHKKAGRILDGRTHDDLPWRLVE